MCVRACVDLLRKTGFVVRMLCFVLNYWGIDRERNVVGGREGKGGEG